MKRHGRQFTAVTMALAVLLVRSAPERSSAQGITPSPSGTDVPYQATAGGSASLTGFRVPGLTLTAQGNGIGKVAIGGASPSTLNATVQIQADVDVTQTPVQIKNGTMTITAPTGDEVQGTFEGQGSAPDASGFMDVTAAFHVTGGKGRWTAGSGTVTGVVNFLRSSFSIGVNGTVAAATAQAPA